MAGERAESAESNAISQPSFDSGLSQPTNAEMSSFSSIREQMTQDTSNLHAMEITGLDTASGGKDGTTGTASPESMKSMSQTATDGNMMMSASDETSADSDPSSKPPAETDPARDSDPNGNPEKPGSDNGLNKMMSSSTDDSTDANPPDDAMNQPPDGQADSLPGTDANAPDGGASGGGKGGDDSITGPTNSPNDKLDSDKDHNNNKPLDPQPNTVPPSQSGPDVPSTPAPGAKPTPAPQEQPLEI